MVPWNWRAHPHYRSRIFPQIRFRPGMDWARRPDIAWLYLRLWAVGLREYLPSAKSSRLRCWRCSRWPWNTLSFKLFGHPGSPFAAWQLGAGVDFCDDGDRCESGPSVDLARAGNSHVPRRLSCAVVVQLWPTRSLDFSRIPFNSDPRQSDSRLCPGLEAPLLWLRCADLAISCRLVAPRLPDRVLSGNFPIYADLVRGLLLNAFLARGIKKGTKEKFPVSGRQRITLQLVFSVPPGLPKVARCHRQPELRDCNAGACAAVMAPAGSRSIFELAHRTSRGFSSPLLRSDLA